jgi:hypothetical protein
MRRRQFRKGWKRSFAARGRPTAADTYESWLEQELGDLIDELDLGERQKRYLRSRWLDQIVWLEKKAKQNQRLYYTLRVIAIVGGVIVPALVSLNVREGDVASAIAWTTFAVSLVVAIAVAVEGFFRYGERWRHYRRTAELLKTEGWQFFQLTGHYRRHTTTAGAYELFASRVEDILQLDIDAYITTVAAEPADKQPKTPQTPDPA